MMISELTDEENLEIMRLLQLSQRALLQAMKPQGFNIGMNLGKVSGAGLEEHLHFHILPRWSGDTNFMTITGNSRIIPQTLIETYEILKPIFHEDI